MATYSRPNPMAGNAARMHAYNVQKNLKAKAKQAQQAKAAAAKKKAAASKPVVGPKPAAKAPGMMSGNV